MGDVVNLRQARKRKQRSDRESASEVARAKHGQSKVETAAIESERALAEKTVDGAKLYREPEH